MTENLEPVFNALRNMQEFEAIPTESLKVTRLGGLTNLVFRVESDEGNVIVRLPGAGTEDYIDRSIELHNAQAAAHAGVSAPVLWADSSTGAMITRCLNPIVTMTPDEFAARAGSPARAGTALKTLHASGEKFEFRFELFSMIDEYLEILSSKDIDLPEGYGDIVKASEPIKQLLEEKAVELAPCHCDPLCENFLDTGEKMWIVDWEYSGMNDPMWDLGDLSVEAGFNAEQDLEMLKAYFGQEPSPAQMGRVVIYKAMCDLLWTLWGLIQHADDNPAEDFWAYAIERFERCKLLMQSEDFAAHVSAVRQS